MCLLAAHLLQCRSSLSRSGKRTFTFEYLFSIIMAATVSLGRPQASNICSIFPLCMELKALAKSTNNIVAPRFFARTTSRIRRIVKICDVVDLFLRKPFWFFLSMFSMMVSMRLRSRALYILAAMEIRVITRQFLDNPRSPFLGKGRMHPFVLLSIVF